MWRLWLVLVVACDRSPDATRRPALARAEDCHAAYAAYQKTWHAAMIEDMNELGDALPPDSQELIANKMSDGLPTRDELAKMREVHKLGMAGSNATETPTWLAAYAAAERAIDLCGEGAKP